MIRRSAEGADALIVSSAGGSTTCYPRKVLGRMWHLHLLQTLECRPRAENAGDFQMVLFEVPALPEGGPGNRNAQEP